MKSMNDTYRLENGRCSLHTKHYVEKRKANFMLKISQQDDIRKDFTLCLLCSETSNLVILHFLCGVKDCSLRRKWLYCSLCFCIPLFQCYWNYRRNINFASVLLHRWSGAVGQLGKVLACYTGITLLEFISKKVGGEMHPPLLSIPSHFPLHFV